MYEIQFKKLYPKAKGFVKATEGAAGWDIYAHTIDINPATRSATIYTGIATAFSPDLVMCLFARSGLATKYGLVLANGTGIVDSDYRGEIMLKFRDLSRSAINQLLYLRTLFDADKAMADTRGTGRHEDVRALTTSNTALLSQGVSVADRYLDKNGRRWVDMRSLFGFMERISLS